MTTDEKKLDCMSQVNNGRWCQESYETASRQASIRAKQLRKLGYTVAVCSLGSQVTPLGLIKTTLVDIRPGIHDDTFYLPEVNRDVWPSR